MNPSLHAPASVAGWWWKMAENGAAKSGNRNQFCVMVMLFTLGTALGFTGYKYVHTYANASMWRRAPARILAAKIKVVSERSGKRSKTVERCDVSYEYTVSNINYGGNHATIHEQLGSKELCRKLRGKKTTVCFYDPKKPENSALATRIPMTITTVMIVGSWVTLIIASCTLPDFFRIVPFLYGIASAAVLLSIAVKRLPIVDAGLIGGSTLLVLAAVCPFLPKAREQRQFKPESGY